MASEALVRVNMLPPRRCWVLTWSGVIENMQKILQMKRKKEIRKVVMVGETYGPDALSLLS